jgi:membrane peptidoglycan carboxypeptidase
VSTGTPPGGYRPGPYNPTPNPYQPRGPYQPAGPQGPPGPPGARRRAPRFDQYPPGGPPRRGGAVRRVLPWIALFLVVTVSGVMGYVLFTIRDVPDPGQVPELGRSVIVNDRKGHQVEQRNSQGQYYEKLKLADMGALNKWATLAAEDREFYNHAAVDAGATARAVGSDLLGRGNLQGGSTITQQLVKISVLTPQRSIFRKLQEGTIAFALENNYSKDQVLEMYLNRVSYGHNAYGIGAATKIYFGSSKNAKDLSIGQAAFLAGIINGPSYYDPQLYYERAKQRQLYVLDGMVKTQRITQAEADQATQENIQAELKFDRGFIQSRAPHFAAYVISVADKLVPPAVAQRGGYTVDTTLDLDLQDLAQRAVTQGVPRLKSKGVNNGDLLAANPQTGDILAWVGSTDFYNDAIAGQVDEIEQGHQPGSSFKPYVFEAALKDRKITLSTTMHDRPTDFGHYAPKDYDNAYQGNITARKSLVESRNVPAVEAAAIVGMPEVIKQAQAQGIHSQLNPNLATAIGASDITMLENLQGYQAFANQGTMVPLSTITKITGADGTVYFQRPDPAQNASHPMTAAEAYLVTDTLKAYPARWNLGWKRPMAGKSGTTNGRFTANGHSDAWMMAYAPDIVVGAWAANTVPNTVNKGVGPDVSAFGVDVGSTILATFINGLPPSNNWYKQPNDIVRGAGCAGSGGDIFLAGTQNGVSCPTPTPTPVPTATPAPTPSAVPSATPRPSPSASPLPIPSGVPTPHG